MCYLLLIDVPDLTGKSPMYCSHEDVDSLLTKIDNSGVFDVRLGIPREDLMMTDEEADVAELIARKNIFAVWNKLERDGLRYSEKDTLVISDDTEWTRTPFQENVFYLKNGGISSDDLHIIKGFLIQLTLARPENIQEFIRDWYMRIPNQLSVTSPSMQKLLLQDSLTDDDDDEDDDKDYDANDEGKGSELDSGEEGSVSDIDEENSVNGDDQEKSIFNYNTFLEALDEISESLVISNKSLLSESDDEICAIEPLASEGIRDSMDEDDSEGEKRNGDDCDDNCCEEDCSDINDDANDGVNEDVDNGSLKNPSDETGGDSSSSTPKCISLIPEQR